MAWTTEPTPEFDAWFDGLGEEDQEHIVAAVMYLEDTGPSAKMPMSFPIRQPNNCGMKELRPASTGRSEIRILYAFDYRRRGILLLGGDKSGDWDAWYDRNVPVGDALFDRRVSEAKLAEKAGAAKDKAAPAPKTQRGRRRR